MSEKERIEVLVGRAGSGKKLAEMLNTSAASVSKLRAGTFRLSVFAERIASAFPDVNCRWLLTGEGEPFSKEANEGEIKAELRALKKAVEKLSEKQTDRR